MALGDLLLDAEIVFQDISFYLNKIIIALVIILVGFIIGKIAEGMLRRLFAKIELDERLTRMLKARRNYARAIRRTIVRVIYIITVLIALNTLSAFEEVIAVLLILAVFIILASWFLAGMDIVPNLLARGALKRKRIGVGDEITLVHETGVIQGIVVDMTLTDVRIKRKNGDLFFIPNSVFINNIIKKNRR
jgi:small-conductance mechanosensitive channel